MEKVQAIMELATPTNVCTLQSFLGMAVYFSHYILGYTSLAAPLFELLKKKAKWEWGKEQEVAFQSVQRALTSAPVLGHPFVFTQMLPIWP